MMDYGWCNYMKQTSGEEKAIEPHYSVYLFLFSPSTIMQNIIYLIDDYKVIKHGIIVNYMA